ncbi:MAG: beta-lactamase family protein [Actinobacteria bacterium]|nr:beta-lactamase family protein [Actinomycetota bacterium]
MHSDVSDIGQTLLDRWPAAHLSVAVLGRDGIVASTGDLDRVYRLASVTKPLVATAVLLAVEEGSLDLDQPAGPPGATLRHLLSHASGVSPDDPATTLAAPGTRRIYSNAGYELAANALAEATGISIHDYLAEGVCAPLSMTRTALTGPAGFGAFSTVGDLANWLGTWIAPGRLLDGSTVAEATSTQFPDLDGVLPGYGTHKPNPWGLGFEIRGTKSPHWTGAQNSPRTFGHFGQSGTFVWVDPVLELGVVALGDADFGVWAVELWSALNDTIISHFAHFAHH